MGTVPDGLNTGDPDASAVPVADAAPGAPDAAPGVADARPNVPPDAAPPATYPAGPYGTGKGATIQNLSWTGFRDTAADGDQSPFNEPVGPIELLAFYRGRDPQAKVIVLTESAGWCSGCAEAARDAPALDAAWAGRGARFVEALYEDYDGNVATDDFARSWGTSYGLTTPTVADPTDKLGDYNAAGTLPMLLFVDADNMKIVEKVYGYDRSQVESLLAAYAQ